MSDPIISHLDHVALRMPEPAAAAGFYESVLGMGRLRGSGSAVKLAVRPNAATSVAAHDLAIYPGEQVGIDHIGFAAISDDLHATLAALRSNGLKIDGPQAFEDLHGDSIRLEDPDGVIVEIMVSGQQVLRPPGPVSFNMIKLGHVTQRSPDPARQCEFWTNRLAFRLSDRIDENFFWLRCNRDHHSMAWVRAAAPGTHHVALEVASWNDIKLVCDHLRSQEVAVEYGPCRHGPGNNVAIYFRDPWGFRWEVFSELERVDDDREPRVWTGDRQGTINLWGPLPAESYYM